ncbi:MAG: isoleucine--tRNA ligase [Opitutales bacterium]|nr:isoleucine--tRNA ligase [Opitutales bacterium]
MAKDFKDTLNLPQTGFPMRGNLVKREPERFGRWEKEKLYRAIQNKNKEGEPFILHDGPPFTNGDVHIGTALNKIPKDTITRYFSMRGRRAPYVPGWDCHGLPIEYKVSRELQAQGKELSRADLRQACAEFSARYIETQRAQFQRLGVLADWENEYRTMDPAYEAEILRAFARFVENDLVYRAKKPVLWSIPCGTALAEAEIEYKDHQSPSIWVKFKTTGDLPGIDGPVSLVIWTTTPWTLPANLAVAVHPELRYLALRTDSETYIVAAERAEDFQAETELSNLQTIGEFMGKDLENLATKHPFIDRQSPVVLADYITTDTGTGCVHIAPGHGLDDYLTGQKYGLPVYCPVDDQGKFADDGQIPPELVGLEVLEKKPGRSPANGGVLKMLDAAGALLALKQYHHSYPHCWRSKTPVVFRAVDQWFIGLDKNNAREKTLEAINKVKWIPSWGESRIRGTVASRPDWCISRQRSWGIPIPVFYNADGEPVLNSRIINQVADRVEKEGTQFWFAEEDQKLAETFLPEGTSGNGVRKGLDTLDVWIDSGVSHLAVLDRNPELRWPADLYLEGSDQHRGWFQSSLWTAVLSKGEAPYKSVLTHGFVVGGDGRKISKSDGKPQTADSYIKTWGADIIRLWVASTDLRNDVPISDDILKQVAENYRSFRNTLRFQLSNLYDFDPAKHAVAFEDLHPIDRWALHQTALYLEAAEEAYDQFSFQKVQQLATHFCTQVLSATYHDVLKDRLYTLAPNHPLRRSSQTALRSILEVLVKTLAPILTFTADEAWNHLQGGDDYGADSIHLQNWPETPAEWKQETLFQEVEQLLRFRGPVNEQLEKARQDKTIGKSLDAKVVIKSDSDNPLFALLQGYETFLPEFFIVSEVSLEASQGEPTVEAFHAEGVRCPRCWRWVPKLVAASDSEEVCPRCAEALSALSTSS